MPLIACGFEAGDSDFYARAGWLVGTVASAMTSRFVHKDSNGFGGKFAIEASSTNTLGTPSIADSANTRWVHFWLDRGGVTSWANGYPITFITASQNQFTVRIQYDGSIQLRRGGVLGVVLATSAGNLDMTKGHWFAIEMSIANSGGVCNVYVDDGALFVGYTGDTQNSNEGIDVTGNWDRVVWGSVTDAFAWIDDVVVTTTSEGQVTETFGRQVRLASDASAGLTPSAGSDNYVNAQNFDTSTYNAGTTATTEDLYGVAGNLVLGTVDWVTINALVASQNGFQMQTALKSGATTSYGTLRSGGASDYTAGESFLDIYTTDPDTASAWTAAGVNALQAGVRTGT